MDIAKRFRTDEQAEVEGIWQNIGGGARLRLARLNNPRYRKLYQRLTRDYRAQLEMGLMPDEVHDPILCQCLAETVLLEWENIQFDGEELPYSKDNALHTLTQLKEFRDLVLRLAAGAEAYRKHLQEEDQKN